MDQNLQNNGHLGSRYVYHEHGRGVLKASNNMDTRSEKAGSFQFKMKSRQPHWLANSACIALRGAFWKFCGEVNPDYEALKRQPEGWMGVSRFATPKSRHLVMYFFPWK
jgi:hypothetical protein